MSDGVFGVDAAHEGGDGGGRGGGLVTRGGVAGVGDHLQAGAGDAGDPRLFVGDQGVVAVAADREQRHLERVDAVKHRSPQQAP